MVIARRHSHTLDFFTSTEEKHLQEKKKAFKVSCAKDSAPKESHFAGSLLHSTAESRQGDLQALGGSLKSTRTWVTKGLLNHHMLQFSALSIYGNSKI